MALPSSIDTAFVRQYSSMLYVLAQQQKSKFTMNVRQEGCQGESKSFERIGEAEVQEITGRHSDTPNNEQPHTRRWVTPKDFDTNSYLDEEDKIKMLIDPTNEYMQNQGRALGRKSDDIIIEAALGTAAAGVTPTTSTVAFKDESVSIDGDGSVTTLGTLAVVSGSLAAITLEKVATMQQLFDDEDVDEEIPRYWAISPKDVRDLLQLGAATSSDYITLRPLETGKVTNWIGFNFIKSTRLTKDAVTSTGRRTIAWAKDGLIYASAKGVESHIDQLPTKRYTTQVYSKMNGGAVRMEGAKVHECLTLI